MTSADFLAFSDGLGAVLDLARMMLRHPHSPKIEQHDDPRHFWGAFFHVALAPAFGEVMPNAEEWRAIAKRFDVLRLELIRKHPDICGALQRLADVQTLPLHMATQFFNADDERVAVFVVPPATGRRHVPKDELPFDAHADDRQHWRDGWGLMNSVNRLEEGRRIRKLPDSNFGNFVVNESEDLQDTCVPLAVKIGGDDAREHLVVPGEVSVEIRSTLRRAEVVDAQAIHALAETDDFWLPFSEFELQVERYFCERFGHGLARRNVRLMLTNNLTILNRFVPIPEEPDRTCCVYYIPSWQKHASYVGIVTPEALDARSLREYRTFTERLFGLTWAVDSVRKHESDKRLIRDRARNAARAAIMSRNLSHNVGSHTLASNHLFRAIGVLSEVDTAPDNMEEMTPLTYPHPEPVSNVDGMPIFHGVPTRGEVWRARTRLATFNSYLQSRMDFIARALGESASLPEPMFFVRDLVGGFLAQTILLNTLIADLNYPAGSIEIVVRIPTDRGYSSVAFHDRRPPGDDSIRHVQFLPTRATYDDVLVSVPGGMVGRHAFFAFMENVLRNAAKYGRYSHNQKDVDSPIEPQKILRVVLTLEDTPAEEGGARSLILRVQENLSEDPDQSVADKIRRHLNEDLIEADHRPRAEGHGIQEMKACAEFLAGGLRFAADSAPAPASTAYARFLTARAGKVAFDGGPLRCFTSDMPLDYLSYELKLGYPTMLQICSARVPDVTSSPPPTAYVHACSSIDEMRPAAHLSLIYVENAHDSATVVDEIASRHTALPYRLLLVVDGDETKQLVEKVVRDAEQRPFKAGPARPGSNEPTTHKSLLPVNRIRVTLRSRVDPLGEFASPKEYWEHRILRAYDAWLEAFKGEELRQAWPDGDAVARKWQLLIGFQRDESILTAWGCGQTGSEWQVPFVSDQVALHLICSGKDGSSVRASSDPLNGPPAAWLALDNHGRALAHVNPAAVAAYHPFSGNAQMALYQTLQTPPEDPFLRDMLVLSTAEALLTRILIVDERVAGASLAWREGQPVDFHDALGDMQRARLYPVLNIHTHRRDGNGNDRPHVHCLVKAENLNFLPEWEGLHVQEQAVSTDGGQAASFVNLVGTDAEPVRLKETVDFIILHEGLVDVLSTGDDPAWTADTHEQLYRLAPSIVRTSGRGSAARHLARQQPFLEFSELSDTTYRLLNKMALTRTLLALTGL